MGVRDPRIDRYIERSSEFARPILSYLREVVHAACPEVEETMKWSSPYFMYHGILCNMAAFKRHCAFGFRKGTLIVEDDGRNAEAMGNFGRITDLSELPPRRTLVRYVKQAMLLNEQGVSAPPKKGPRSAAEPPIPEDLAAALKRNRAARTSFDEFSPSHRREYIEWITEAKREETRRRRVATTVEWLAEGKSRNWKYARS